MTRCKSCNAMMVFLTSKKKNKQIPVDIATVSENELEELNKGHIVYFVRGKHTTHFDTCPDAAKFRKKKKGGTQLSFFDLS